MKNFIIKDTPLQGLKVVQRSRASDKRGYISRLFCANQFSEIGWTKPILQINHTYTQYKGTVRGMHFQTKPFIEMKIVTCLRGEIWDVAVDIRANSPTFLKWYAVNLSEQNGRSFIIPEGFAHGFQALTDDVELIYFHTERYVPEAEGGLHPSDPYLNIPWPNEISHLSIKDSSHPLIAAEYHGIKI